jgi:hypothetical protein
VTQSWSSELLPAPLNRAPGFKLLEQAVNGKATAAEFNVVDYGTRGNGVGDDAPAIQAAFTAALAAGRSLVRIPPGNYTIASKTTLTNASNLVIWAYGATFTLTSAATYGLEIAGTTTTNLRIYGLHVIGAGIVPAGPNGGQTGIGTGIQIATGGAGLLTVDCEVENVARGIYIDSSSANAWTGVRHVRPYAHEILGTFSGTGYGILNGSSDGTAMLHPRVTAAQRHGIYNSVTTDTHILGGMIKNHRAGLGTGTTPFGGIECARSSGLVVDGVTFDACEDGALAIENHESNPAWVTRNFRIINCLFRNSKHQDIVVGFIAPAGTSALTDVEIRGNTFERPTGATNANVPIYINYCKALRITNNSIRALNAYTVAFAAIYLATTGGAAYTDDVVIEDNDYQATLGGGGALYGVQIAPATCAGTSRVSVRHRLWDVTGTAYAATFDGALSNPNLHVVDRRSEQGKTSDRGDANVTFSTNDAEWQLFATALTVNRTITLPTVDVYAGRRFRISRPATGASTLDVGGVKTLAAGQWCAVAYDGTVWRVESFGSL